MGFATIGDTKWPGKNRAVTFKVPHKAPRHYMEKGHKGTGPSPENRDHKDNLSKLTVTFTDSAEKVIGTDPPLLTFDD